MSKYSHTTKTGRSKTGAALALLVTAGWLNAVQADELDITMTVVDSDKSLPDAVTKTIELPPSASDTGREKSAFGLERANEARSNGRAHGQSVAEEAKARRGRPAK